MALPHYDESRWPILVVKLPADFPDRDLDAHLTVLRTKYFDRGVPFAMVVDTTHATEMTAGQRRHLAERTKAEAAIRTRILAGVAIVLDSPVKRGVLTALHWLFPPPYPTKACRGTGEALEWVRGLLASRAAA